jgi:hypothetical protein
MSVPTWNDLLISLDSFPSALGNERLTEEQAEQLKRIAMSATELHSVLTSGIAAIGWALACAADNEDFGIDLGEISSLGWLLKELGNLSEALSFRQGEAEYRLHHCKRTVADKPKE